MGNCPLHVDTTICFPRRFTC